MRYSIVRKYLLLEPICYISLVYTQYKLNNLLLAYKDIMVPRPEGGLSGIGLY